jgi:hypothetical protein
VFWHLLPCLLLGLKFALTRRAAHAHQAGEN